MEREIVISAEKFCIKQGGLVFEDFKRSKDRKISDVYNLSQRQGECYATTSMWKVELELELNFLSGSVFVPRLVRQVISVPFVV